ncbi:hypothetical protein [Lignipirellula cremea]|uniref:Uncharacterized protein n=1 Tax=Lignipirellula cremea TaxID=2528010 RepID=A0A518DKN6_9BACT|nr:hypothetical protein [Lignipirellula cremea]QDU92396.1 hypothetical protein Pla8534_01430 [Lignipirellula cremea]
MPDEEFGLAAQTVCSGLAGELQNGQSARRQRKPKEIREQVIEIAKTTGFACTRIIGELRKLGIKKVSRQTV